MMQYTGTIWRPPYEASSLLFGSYRGLYAPQMQILYALRRSGPFPFRMSPMGDIEGDLKEVQKKYCSFCGRKATRTFLTGAPPFVLKYNRLVENAELVHRYFPEMETIGSFARVTDITLKTDEEFAALHEAGQGGYLLQFFSI